MNFQNFDLPLAAKSNLRDTYVLLWEEGWSYDLVVPMLAFYCEDSNLNPSKFNSFVKIVGKEAVHLPFSNTNTYNR